MDILTRQVVYRNPYVVEHLPAIARLHRAAWSPSQRMRQEISKLPLRPLFALAYRLGLGGIGRMRLSILGKWKPLPFDARNLQFTSLYMPQHAQGYETETAALLDALVTSRAVFYDVGSNWGYYALWIAGREGFEGQVHAFEPLPASFRDLQDLVTRTELSSRITCHNVGLSDHTDEGRIVIPDGLHSGLATISQGQDGIPISLKSLDEMGLAPPDVVKMDVEDHELRVLAGGHQTFNKAKPHIVFESFWGRQTPTERLAPFKLLEGMGYLFFHPAWVEPTQAGGYAECSRWRPGEAAILALVPFQPHQRFLLKEHLNVLACHKEKFAQLAALFSSSISHS